MRSQPALWYRLVAAMQEFGERTGGWLGVWVT